MKKLIISLFAVVFLIVILGTVFFYVDKGEYYSKGETKFTINENMGSDITRRIGLGYVMYTRATGFPTNPNDNIMKSWFSAPGREEALKILLGDDAVLEGLIDTDLEIVKYYTNLIMQDLNSHADKFNLDEIKKIYVNINNFENLETGRPISAQAIVSIQDLLNTKLAKETLSVENRSLDELEKETDKYTNMLQAVKDGIYVDVKRIKSSDEVEIQILKSALNQTKTRYSFDLSKLNTDESNFEIFTLINK